MEPIIKTRSLKLALPLIDRLTKNCDYILIQRFKHGFKIYPCGMKKEKIDEQIKSSSAA